MKTDVRLFIVRLTSIALISIVIAMGAVLQFTGLGIISNKNSQTKIETITLTDITGEKEKINPDLSIQNNNGILVELNDLNDVANVVEIDVEALNGTKHLGRIYYSADGSFIIKDSSVIEIREGKNFITLNKNNLKALYFDLPLSGMTLKSVTINPNYSIFELIRYGLPLILVNFCVLLISFLFTFKRPHIQIKKAPYGVWALGIVMLLYYNKFLMIMGKTLWIYAQGILFLAVVLLGLEFSKIVLKEYAGAMNDDEN